MKQVDLGNIDGCKDCRGYNARNIGSHCIGQNKCFFIYGVCTFVCYFSGRGNAGNTGNPYERINFSPAYPAGYIAAQKTADTG